MDYVMYKNTFVLCNTLITDMPWENVSEICLFESQTVGCESKDFGS